jgi:carbon storage regulator
MLVLSRKQGESICIGQNVAVTVLGIDGGRVKIGVTAPPEIAILRGELRDLADSSSGEAPVRTQLSTPAAQRRALLPACPVKPCEV